MAKFEGITQRTSRRERKNRLAGCGKLFLLVGIFCGLFLIVPATEAINTFLNEAGFFSTPMPRATRTTTPTPGPTPTFEEWKESAEEIPYRTLFRYAEQNEGKRVYYRGKVIQVLEDDGDFHLRVNVTPGDYGFWDDTVFLRYDDAPVRILEDDIIAFVGRMNGTITYESVMGGKVTIPDITVLSLIIESE